MLAVQQYRMAKSSGKLGHAYHVSSIEEFGVLDRVKRELQSEKEMR